MRRRKKGKKTYGKKDERNAGKCKMKKKKNMNE